MGTFPRPTSICKALAEHRLTGRCRQSSPFPPAEKETSDLVGWPARLLLIPATNGSSSQKALRRESGNAGREHAAGGVCAPGSYRCGMKRFVTNAVTSRSTISCRSAFLSIPSARNASRMRICLVIPARHARDGPSSSRAASGDWAQYLMDASVYSIAEFAA